MTFYFILFSPRRIGGQTWQKRGHLYFALTNSTAGALRCHFKSGVYQPEEGIQ